MILVYLSYKPLSCQFYFFDCNLFLTHTRSCFFFLPSYLYTPSAVLSKRITSFLNEFLGFRLSSDPRIETATLILLSSFRFLVVIFIVSSLYRRSATSNPFHTFRILKTFTQIRILSWTLPKKRNLNKYLFIVTDSFCIYNEYIKTN